MIGIAADVPDEHAGCPPLCELMTRPSFSTRSRLVIRCMSKPGHTRVIALVYGAHLVHRFGCVTYPPARHEALEVPCDKCPQVWLIDARRLIEGVQQKRKVSVADIARPPKPRGVTQPPSSN
ncbi:hypothetical protein GCM10009814_35400 [Lapillicoccus jejuensis]|uniref:Uncharacterized protein n=1 Tax=Lapillicoccus jejuensis TaxID=402171 RepID=A0A542DVU0_9MICO|nr:hypothetical protein FB458_0262 [Lapillicoccus jejuensis]